MSSKKRKSLRPLASWKKAPQRKKSGKRFHKHPIRLAASDQGSCLEQEKLLALDEEDN